MDRRSFIKTASISASAVGSGLVQACPKVETPESNPEHFQQINTAIKAEFGAGFELLGYMQKDGTNYAEVAHLENHYWLSSAKLEDWQIINNSPI